MAVIQLTIPDAAMPRVIDALCARGDYDGSRAAFLDANPGGQFPTRAQFAKSMLADFVRTVTKHFEAEAAAEAARKTAAAKAESEVTVT